VKQHKAGFITFSVRWNYSCTLDSLVRSFMKMAAIARGDIGAWLTRPEREKICLCDVSSERQVELRTMLEGI
jgi:hypothetical protein